MRSSFFFRLSPLVRIALNGKSMEPTLFPRQKILVIKYWFARPHVRDIILCVHPHTDDLLVKRIVKQKSYHSGILQKDTRYWVEGDNTNESTDSRDFGWLTSQQIIGKVLVKTK